MGHGYALIVIFSLLLGATAKADQSWTPVEPAYVSDQDRLTVLGLQFEALQFRALGQWHSARNRVVTEISRRERLADELRQAEQLSGKDYMSKEAYLAASYAHREAVNNVRQAELEVKQAAANMAAQKFKVLSEGSFETDMRLKIIEAHIEEARYTIEGLKISLETADYEIDLRRRRLKSGQALFDKHAISEDEYEDRKLDLDLAERKGRGVREQILAAEAALKGLEASQRRLKINPDTCCSRKKKADQVSEGK